MTERGEDGGTVQDPEFRGTDNPRVDEVESFLNQSTEAFGAQGGKTSTGLGTPLVLGGVGAIVVLPASLLALVWLSRRRERPPITSPRGMSERLRATPLVRAVPWQASSWRRPKEPRITRLTRQTRAQVGGLSDQLWAMTVRNRQPQKVSKWEAAGSQVQGNRMTLAALALAVSTVATGRLLDRRASKSPES